MSRSYLVNIDKVELESGVLPFLLTVVELLVRFLPVEGEEGPVYVEPPHDERDDDNYYD